MFSCYDASRSVKHRTRLLDELLEEGELDFDSYVEEVRRLVDSANRTCADPAKLRAFQQQQADEHNRQWCAATKLELRELQDRLAAIDDEAIYNHGRPVEILKRTPKRLYVRQQGDPDLPCSNDEVYILPLDKLYEKQCIYVNHERFELGSHERADLLRAIEGREESLARYRSVTS